MENKLPNPYEFFIGAMLKTNAGLNNKIPEQNMIDAFKEYGRQVRDYTLKIASDLSQLCLRKYNSHAEIEEELFGQEVVTERENEYWGISKDSILNLKNSKQLEI